MELELPEEIITETKQERSIISRAVLEALLLGPVGAIVGGMTGLKDGEKTESDKSLLTVQVEQNGQESFSIAAVPKSRRDLAKAFLQIICYNSCIKYYGEATTTAYSSRAVSRTGRPSREGTSLFTWPRRNR